MTTNSAFLESLSAIGAEIRSDETSLSNYGRDWSRLHTPAPSAVIFPQSTDQVCELVARAIAHKHPLVPSGGRTGLSGGATATKGELVVSFEKMNQIKSFDPVAGTAICEPGVITQTLQEYAQSEGWYYPVDFGSRGSSQIGGNIATNAGGIKVIRYGLTRQWVNGLTVVTGKGDLLDLNHGLIKNATGYDLRQLFIGSEGTLGLIVEAVIQFTRPPVEPRVLLLALPHLDAIMQCFGTFSQHLALNAFECFTDRCLEHVIAAGVPAPFDHPHPYYALLEFDCPDNATFEKALDLFAQCIENGSASDGISSESSRQARDLWRLREDITESIAALLPYKNDVSVPVSQVGAFMRKLDQLLSREYPLFDVLFFGHVGDGNLHVNIIKHKTMEHTEFLAQCEQVNTLLFTTIQEFNGSISAEHGVGLTKRDYLSYSRSAEEIAYMRGLKQVFDPAGIMNPGKIFQ